MQDQEQKKFQTYLIISILLHMIFACVFMYGIPFFKKEIPEQEIIVFDMVDAADVPNIRNQTPKPSPEPEIKESQRIKQAAEKPEEKEEPKIEEPQKEEPKPEEAEVIPEKKVEPKPKKEEPKPKKEKVKPKEKLKPKKPAKKQEDVIDDILKKLEKESEGQEKKSENRNTSSSAAQGKYAKGHDNFDEDSPLSVTEKMLIKKQIEKNWQPPVGIANVENVQVILHLKILEDGTIASVKIKDVLCPAGSNDTCDLLAQSAARATKKASPLQNLRPNRYDVWKEFDLRFDPSEFME